MSNLEGPWDPRNWIQFKIYDNPEVKRNSKECLDWYHGVLRAVIRPVVQSNASISFILFTVYGLPQYEQFETNIAEKALSKIPSAGVFFVKLRIFPTLGSRTEVLRAFERQFETGKSSIWDYEVLREYDVLGDLGNRYGRGPNGEINRDITMLFLRYWDAGCRYILSIITDEGNWLEKVDVWGVPHLINNALGGWLRLSAAKCPSCGEAMYMKTTFIKGDFQIKVVGMPSFLAECPKCGKETVISTNI